MAEGLQRKIDGHQLREFRIQRDRREQAFGSIQTVSGLPVHMPTLRIVQKEAFRVRNNNSPNLDDESSDS
ncbi:MAG: hypothetical protein EZS28_035305 [Streblomastix strix]|uniref:Uncharacterized protein n=1 Tax=Streblomastix strix TaxID=222440 RepID=A0A5J4UFG5_9EUKA|nr:MAG: hypothetical protein EZS28_035305 [Streblomastix strix]